MLYPPYYGVEQNLGVEKERAWVVPDRLLNKNGEGVNPMRQKGI